MQVSCRWVNCRRMLCAEIGDNPEIFIANLATMNRLEAMTLFVRVADLGSFAAAANQLGVARSVVTRQIAALEEHLGKAESAKEMAGFCTVNTTHQYEFQARPT